MDLVSRFDALMGRFYNVLGTLVGISIGIFPVAISLDLLLRRLGWGNLPGVQEIIEYALFAGVFLAAPWVLRLGAHVRVDVLISALPPPAARLLDKLLDLSGLIICLVLVRYGLANLSQAYGFNSLQMKYFNVPEWWLLTVFVACFVLLSVEFLARLVRGGNPPEADEESAGGV